VISFNKYAARLLLAMRRYRTRHRRALCRYTTQTSDRLRVYNRIGQKSVETAAEKEAMRTLFICVVA